MMKLKKICVIADGYPYGESNHCVFVRELVSELTKQGIKCDVVVPQMISPIKKKYLPYHYTDVNDSGGMVDIWCPKFYHFSSQPGAMRLSQYLHYRAVYNVIVREKLNPDAVYGHFIYLNGISAIRIAQKLGRPSYIACGENTNRLIAGSKPYSTGLKYHGWRKILEKVNGIIAVSSENRDLLLEVGYISSNTPVCVLPNGVNTTKFAPGDGRKKRRELKIEDDNLVVSFVGHFIPRKGPDRVDNAVADLDDVKTIFIGAGAFEPKSNCVVCGQIPHEEIPEYLRASDVFVLPTTGEGCCNAIIEALCCGIPVISSNGKFNDDILNDQVSIRIDPLNIDEIRASICSLKDDRARLKRMKNSTLEWSKRFSLEERAKNVIAFIEGNGQNAK